MITARAPLRLPLGGGGTDLLWYAQRNGGLLLSAAINLHVFLVVNRGFSDERIRVKLETNENVGSFDDLKNDIVRAALEWADIKNNIEIVFMGDISGGTGLGTSSAYVVNLVNALSHLNRRPLSPQELAEAACHIEIGMLKRPIGPQDQFMAAYGGIRLLHVNKDGSVRVEDPHIPFDTIEELRNTLLLFNTGQKRQSGAILGAQKKAAEAGKEDVFEYYDRIKEIGCRIVDALQTGDVLRFGELMHEHWETKRQLPGGTSNLEIDRLYALARNYGAVGGKIMGAGGGGYFAFLVEHRRKAMFREILSQNGLREVPFDIDYEGAVLDSGFLNRREVMPRLKIHSER